MKQLCNNGGAAQGKAQHRLLPMKRRYLPRGLANSEIAYPPITLDLPLALVFIPDDLIGAGVTHPLVTVEKAIRTHFRNPIGQATDLMGFTEHGPNPHIKTALPKRLDRCPSANGGAVGRQ